MPVISAAVVIYVLEYTDLLTAPASDPLGFVNDKLNGLDMDSKAINMQAFLMTIRKWESSTRPDAYTLLYGGSHFTGFADHPRIAKPIGNTGLYSTAAGAYQILAVSKTPKGMTKINTWDRIKKKLNLPDFSPASQDAAAIELIKERGAYYDVINGNFSAAVAKCKDEWASMPFSEYGQPTADYPSYQSTYLSFGGKINVNA